MLNDIEGVSFCQLHLGRIMLFQKNNNEARKYLDSSIIYSKQIGSKTQLRDGYFNLFKLDSTEKKYVKAIENLLYYVRYGDSLHNSEISEQTLKTSMKYEFSKKEDSLKHEAEKRDFLNKEELKREKNIRNFSLLGVLGLSFFLIVLFRQRNKIRKEKIRSEELLLNILPAEITDELKERGETTAKHYDEVTVMFTDFVEFTKIGEQLSPQVLVQELHECFSAFDAIMERNGLEKIKTVGDAYIAVCGLPIMNKLHAEKAVQAALEIRQFMEARKKQEKVFDIRIGIHSGPVVAGIVGVKKFAYDIWGDTVNTSARMEQSSEAGKINISETTYALVKDKFSCAHRGKIAAKGKGEIDMYFVEK
jgi:class 3 adenylate cyclase